MTRAPALLLALLAAAPPPARAEGPAPDPAALRGAHASTWEGAKRLLPAHLWLRDPGLRDVARVDEAWKREGFDGLRLTKSQFRDLGRILRDGSPFTTEKGRTATLRIPTGERGKDGGEETLPVRVVVTETLAFLKPVSPIGPSLQIGEMGETDSSGPPPRSFEVFIGALREHYAETLAAWLGRLEARFGAAEELVGRARARAYRLYLASSSAAFRLGRISVFQLLLAKRTEAGRAEGVPRNRPDWYRTASRPGAERAGRTERPG